MIYIPFSSDVIIGSSLVVLGTSFILKALFGIDIPLLKILFGVILIFWGISMFVDIEFAPTKRAKKAKRGTRYEFSVEVDEEAKKD